MLSCYHWSRLSLLKFYSDTHTSGTHILEPLIGTEIFHLTLEYTTDTFAYMMLNTTAKDELNILGNTNQWHKYLHLHGEQTHSSVYSMWNKKYNFTEPRGTMWNQHSDDWTNKAARGNRYFQSRSPPMKMLSELLALCERYTAVTGWFPYWRVSNAGLWYFLFSNPNNCWTHL